MISAWNTAVEADTKFLEANKEHKSTKIKITEDLSINITELADLLALALMILGNANVQTAQFRWENFQYYLHYDYHDLLRFNNPITEFLFGDDVKTKIGDCDKI